ncbi:MAG: sugar phosphate isomerase/epimerase [Sedimentisphaerales bacterium]|jgi:sugar phosphate isomerase/epimerase
MVDKQTRRDVLKLAGMGVLAAGLKPETAVAAETEAKPSSKAKFNLGIASYTFRKFSTEQTLAMTKRLGLKYISFKDFHMPLNSTPEQIQNTVAKVKEAGITLYACGVIYMKTEADIQQAFDYARAAGVKLIVGMPNYELLGLVENKAKEYDIKVAIHNHGPDNKLFPSPASVYEKVKDLDKRIGLCIDVGHTQRSGIDPSEAVEKFADRLLDIHIKDESSATTEGTTVEMGRGVVDLVKLMRTLEKIGYSNIAAFEYEKDENDPLAGVAESVGYTRGILACI